jgi:hypothetical protein
MNVSLNMANLQKGVGVQGNGSFAGSGNREFSLSGKIVPWCWQTGEGGEADLSPGTLTKLPFPSVG